MGFRVCGAFFSIPGFVVEKADTPVLELEVRIRNMTGTRCMQRGRQNRSSGKCFRDEG